MKQLISKASLALSALTVLNLGTAITVHTTSACYTTHIGTMVASQFCNCADSNHNADPRDPEPPAKGKTGGSRMHSSLEKSDIIMTSKIQPVLRPFENFPGISSISIAKALSSR